MAGHNSTLVCAYPGDQRDSYSYGRYMKSLYQPIDRNKWTRVCQRIDRGRIHLAERIVAAHNTISEKVHRYSRVLKLKGISTIPQKLLCISLTSHPTRSGPNFPARPVAIWSLLLFGVSRKLSPCKCETIVCHTACSHTSGLGSTIMISVRSGPSPENDIGLVEHVTHGLHSLSRYI